MKNVFLLFSLVLISSANLFAQNKTLSFNQVLLVNSSIQTVPAGKVWKIDGVAGQRVTDYRYSSGSNGDYSPADCIILINGTPVSVLHTVGTGAGNGNGNGGAGYSGFSYAGSPTSLPIWLPEFTTLAASTNISYISVIEFNVVLP